MKLLQIVVFLLFTMTSFGQTYAKISEELLTRSIEGVTHTTHIQMYLGDDSTKFAIALSSISYDVGETKTSAQNLVYNVPWDEDPSTPGNQAPYTDVQAAFDNGRRVEEDSLGLVPNILGTPLVASGTDNDLALLIHNDERNVRHNVDYGTGAVTCLPMENYEAHVIQVAKDQASDMLQFDYFGHINSSGDSPSDRIDNHAVLGIGACSGGDGHEFLARVENLAGFWTSGDVNPKIIERAFYNWMYVDSTSGWGHREAVLLGDIALNGQNGYDDNYGTPGETGFMGIATQGDNNGVYNPYDWSWVDRGDVVVFVTIDPVDNDCGYLPGVEDVALPVTLISFEARSMAEGNLLTWEAANEDIDRYQLQYSHDGFSWQYLQNNNFTVKNQNLHKIYTAIDKRLLDLVYYRLKIIDIDGSYTYSPIRSIKRDVHIAKTIYPNPVDDVLSLQGFGEELDYQIHSMEGKLMQVGKTSISIDCSSLLSGVYIITINNQCNELLIVR